MKKHLHVFVIACTIMLFPYCGKANVAIQDSLALVDLYNSTNGPQWTVHTNWLILSAVETWSGITVTNGRVSGISLDSHNLNGTLPASLGNLDGLTYCNLGGNQLSGSIPSSLGNCVLLEQLNLYFNNLSGTIPVSIGNLTNLSVLTLNHNSLSGSIPASLGNLTKLTYLPLLENQLTGVLPDELGNLVNLTIFNVSKNALTGTIPATLGNLVNLTVLDISNNQITGPIPSLLSNCLLLTSLILSYNQLNGSIPALFGNMPNLVYLELDNNLLTGSIPAEVGLLSNLHTLRLNNNQLTGSIPTSIGNLPNATIITLGVNQLTGTIPPSLGNIVSLFALDLSYNQLTGTIPGSLNQLVNLNSFAAGNNALTGAIPDLGNDVNLVYCSLNQNSLSGTIPLSFNSLVNLRILILDHNQFTGTIPGYLGNMPNLRVLQLNNNKLSGTIPATLNQSTTISTLHVENNQFSFAGMESLVNKYQTKLDFGYAPQDSLRMLLNGNTLSVAAGGTLARNSYKWYKNGNLVATKTADSTFMMDGDGDYYASVSNSTAVLLTLFSRHHMFGNKQGLSDVSNMVVQNIQGTSMVDINDTSFNKILSIEPTNVNGDILFGLMMKPGEPRRYTVTPSNNAATTNATLSLYFTQEDFATYNNYVLNNHLSNYLLPAGTTDNGNVRITKMDADTVTAIITPTATWDVSNGWWVVRFAVTGFSDFILSTANQALPLKLLKFEGSLQNKQVQLRWTTTQETNTDEFIIQVSRDGNKFISNGNVKALSTPGDHVYSFADTNYPASKAFYRLQMIDRDGHSNFSNTVIVKTGIINDKLYPNPVLASTLLQFTAGADGAYTIIMQDAGGKRARLFSGYSVKGDNQVHINVGGLLPGLYTIVLLFADSTTRTWQLIKQ